MLTVLSGVPVPRLVENVYCDDVVSPVLSDVMTSYHLIRFMNHHHTGLIRFRSYPGLLWDRLLTSQLDRIFPISSNRQICGRLLLDDLFSNLLKTTLGSHAQTTTDIIYSYNKHKKRETTKLPNDILIL